MKRLRWILVGFILVALFAINQGQINSAVAASKIPAVFTNVEASWRRDSAYPTFLRGQMPLPATVQAAAVPDADAARAFLATYAQRFGINDVARELQTVTTEVDALGISHVTFQQTVQGVPVYNSLLKVHLDRNANLVLAVGNGYVAGLGQLSILPQVAAADALRLAQRLLPGAASNQPPTLVIYPGVGGQRSAQQARLAWLVDLHNNIAHKIFVIDANAGQLFDVLERSYASQLAPVQPPSAFERKLPFATMAQKLATYAAQNAETLPGTLLRSDDEPVVGDADVDHAHDFAKLTLAYYLTNFGRNSFDDNGAVVISTVHYGVNMQNAYWNGEQMVYGDGFPVLDIVGHELTHAVTQSTANLEYRWQSGALNESFSDIFGAMLDRDDWLIGEDIAPDAFGQEAFRDMAQPERFSQPGHTDAWVQTCADQEGVHTNSGIFNKAYYNIATAIGKDKAEQIFYKTLVDYLQPTSSFQDARSAVLQATTDLYATLTLFVTKGFDDVGITATWQPEANQCTCIAIASLSSADSKQTIALLHDLRDLQMSKTATGRYYTDLYYKTTTEISVLLLANPSLRTRTGQIIEIFTPGLQNLLAAQGADTQISAEMVAAVRAYLVELEQSALDAGNEALVNTIATESARIDWARLPGMTFVEAWDYVNSLGGFFSLFLPTIQR